MRWPSAVIGRSVVRPSGDERIGLDGFGGPKAPKTDQDQLSILTSRLIKTCYGSPFFPAYSHTPPLWACYGMACSKAHICIPATEQECFERSEDNRATVTLCSSPHDRKDAPCSTLGVQSTSKTLFPDATLDPHIKTSGLSYMEGSGVEPMRFGGTQCVWAVNTSGPRHRNPPIGVASGAEHDRGEVRGERSV